jgi:CSLREA domain-containing protein
MTLRLGLLLLLLSAGAAFGATFTVTKETDDDGPCEPDDCALREAILAANALPGPDVVVLPSGTYPLTLVGPVEENDGFTGDLDIRDALELRGDSVSPPTIIGDGTDRVLHALVLASKPVEISHVVVTGGNGSGGGGIRAGGTFTLRNSTLVGNVSSTFGGGLLFAGRTATIEGTTFRGNTAGIRGGGFHRFLTLNFDRTQLINSTVVENHAPVGGGVYVSSDGPFDFIHTTIAGNTSTAEFGSGAAWDLVQRLSFYNTLIAGNNCGGPIANTNGHNIEGPSSTCFLPGEDQTGVADLGLGVLGDYGGPTPTLPILPGSPALDAALLGDCPETDQRGIFRPQGSGCDVGAFESEISAVEIPTLRHAGLVLLAALLGAAGWRRLRNLACGSGVAAYLPENRPTHRGRP